MKLSMKFLFLAAGLCATASEAASAYYRLNGTSCFSITAGLQASANRWGVYNTSSTKAMDVSCPVQLPDLNYTYAYIGISVYNRNSSDMTSCTLNMSNDDGYQVNSATAKVMTSSDNVLYATKYTYPASGNRNPWVTCHIPPSSGGSYSYVNSIYLSFQY